MRSFSFCLLIAAFTGNIAFAQKSAMMGKVVNETGKPVAGAELKISGHKGYYKLKTDNDGNYTTPPLTPAYYHVIIDANERYYTTERIKVMKPGEMREHHNFTLTNDHAEVVVTEETDPAFQAKQDSVSAYYQHMEEYNAPSKTDDTETRPAASATRDEYRAEQKEERVRARRAKSPTIKIIPGEKPGK